MNIDVGKIVNDKIKQMEEGRVLEKLIEETLQQSMEQAVINALDSYHIKRKIEESMEKCINEIVKDIGFSAYNSFVAETMDKVLTDVLKGDIAQKVRSKVENTLLKKRDSIKLTEIVDEYKKLYDDMSFEEKEEIKDGYFYIEFKKENYKWNDGIEDINIIFAKNHPTKDYLGRNRIDSKFKLELRIRNDIENNVAKITNIRFEDSKLSNFENIICMDRFEAFLMNLYLNKTTIEIDVDDEMDIENFVGNDY